MDFRLLEEAREEGWKLTLLGTVCGVSLFLPFLATTSPALPGASRHGLSLPGGEPAGNGLPETREGE